MCSANRYKAVILLIINNLHLKFDFGPDCRGISKPFKSFQKPALSLFLAALLGLTAQITSINNHGLPTESPAFILYAQPECRTFERCALRLGGKTPLGVYRALKASSPQGYDAKKS